MHRHHEKSKRFLASALITTGLLGATPILGDEIVPFGNVLASQENLSPRIDAALCNQRFQCNKTGFMLHFLPDSKALFIHPHSQQTLHADYRVRFNHSIAMNVYENPSRHFDLTMHQVHVGSDGFSARIGGEDRYFQKV